MAEPPSSAGAFQVKAMVVAVVRPTVGVSGTAGALAAVTGGATSKAIEDTTTDTTATRRKNLLMVKNVRCAAPETSLTRESANERRFLLLDLVLSTQVTPSPQTTLLLKCDQTQA
jgi:hypothetical protein